MYWVSFVILFAVVCRLGTVAGQGYQYTQNDFEAIRKVETGRCPDPLNAVGDNGRSIGPYQIMQSYYEDAVEHNPTLRNSISYSDLKGPGSIEKSEAIMQAYSNRYTTASRIGREPTFEDAARNHNGGPNGYRKDATLSYYAMVEHNRNRNKRAVIYSNATGEYLGCPNSAILHFQPNVVTLSFCLLLIYTVMHFV
jgi:hypothetical protein